MNDKEQETFPNNKTQQRHQQVSGKKELQSWTKYLETFSHFSKIFLHYK